VVVGVVVGVGVLTVVAVCRCCLDVGRWWCRRCRQVDSVVGDAMMSPGPVWCCSDHRGYPSQGVLEVVLAVPACSWLRCHRRLDISRCRASLAQSDSQSVFGRVGHVLPLPVLETSCELSLSPKMLGLGVLRRRLVADALWLLLVLSGSPPLRWRGRVPNTRLEWKK